MIALANGQAAIGSDMDIVTALRRADANIPEPNRDVETVSYRLYLDGTNKARSPLMCHSLLPNSQWTRQPNSKV